LYFALSSISPTNAIGAGEVGAYIGIIGALTGIVIAVLGISGNASRKNT
jgi:hypothetical protein